MFISFLPIFPGYLFLYADDEEHHVGVTCRHAASLQVVPDQVQFDADIRQVRKLIACGAAVTAEDKLAPGMAVEIKHGPLKGLSGTILSSVSGKRFVVVVNFLRQGASVMLDDAMLAKVS
jgi:transcription antitermination factor NusG